MSGMSGTGMDESSDGLFRPTAEHLSHIYWYLIIGAIGFGLVANVIRKADEIMRYACLNCHCSSNRLTAILRKRAMRHDPSSKPARPASRLTLPYYTALTVVREVSYPQVFVVKRQGFQWLTPPCLGRIILILIYWVVIIIMITENAIIDDAYYFERIGFRAAWICVMQLPFIILLSAKVSIVGWLIGSSYERLNWAHRWAARTLFICVTIHGGFFLREWVRADFVALEIEMMPMVKYGMGSWCVLLWINITSLAPFRYMAHEIFVIQHLASAAVLLWLVHTHVPDYAYYYVWIAIAFVAFDRVARWAWLAYRNTTIFSGKGTNLSKIGYDAELHAAPGDTTRVTIKNVTWKWKPGQHVYLWIPRIGFIETHPFTISNTYHSGGVNDATIAVRKHSGFSQRLYNFAAKRSSASRPTIVKALIQGPYGAHPDWNTFDTVVLISASTGASFTLPILEGVLENPCVVKNIRFLLLVRSRPQCSCYLARLRDVAAKAVGSGIQVRVQIAVTGEDTDLAEGDANGELGSRCVCGPNTASGECCCGGVEPSSEKIEYVDEDTGNVEQVGGKAACCSTDADSQREAKRSVDGDIISKPGDPLQNNVKSLTTRAPSETYSDPPNYKTEIEWSFGSRPNIEEFIRYPVEAASGETCVAVCGGKSLSGRVRNVVTRMSDERAVHKGTGAMAIMLHVEEFGF